MVRKRNALIVDDDDGVRFVLREALARQGWQVAEVEDGSLVEEEVEQRRYDLILLDLSMPGMNGYEVLRRLRGSGPGPILAGRTPRTVRVVVLSGASEREGFEFAQRIGADACLEKPFELDDLLSLLGP